MVLDTDDKSECGMACELTELSDFFVVTESKCFCGDFNHLLGTISTKTEPRQKVHFKKESIDEYLDQNWIKIDESNQQWTQWIYKRIQQGEGTGHRICLFEAMYQKECDFAKFDWDTKECFFGSFHYYGSSLVTNTDQLSEVTYIKKGKLSVGRL